MRRTDRTANGQCRHRRRRARRTRGLTLADRRRAFVGSMGDAPWVASREGSRDDASLRESSNPLFQSLQPKRACRLARAVVAALRVVKYIRSVASYMIVSAVHLDSAHKPTFQASRTSYSGPYPDADPAQRISVAPGIHHVHELDPVNARRPPCRRDRPQVLWQIPIVARANHP